MKRERGIWQRRYWGHQIRDDDDLEKHMAYVHFNLVKHGYVEKAVDWPYSSIHREIARANLNESRGYRREKELPPVPLPGEDIPLLLPIGDRKQPLTRGAAHAIVKKMFVLLHAACASAAKIINRTSLRALAAAYGRLTRGQ